MVWTLATRGKTEYAYGSLRPDYIIDDVVIASETGAFGAGSSSPETRSNVAPVVTVLGDPIRSATVGQTVTLVATVADDGLPRVRRRSTPPAEEPPSEEPPSEEPPAEEPPKLTARQLRPPTRITVNKRLGLHLSWFVFRGAGEVSFDPLQVKVWEDTRAGANSPWAPLWAPPEVPEDGRWELRVTFDRPGTYVLRARADDGGLYHDADVTIDVAASNQR